MKKSELRHMIREELLTELGSGLSSRDRKKYNIDKDEQPTSIHDKGKIMKKQYSTLTNYFRKITEKMGGGKHGNIVKEVTHHYAEGPFVHYIFEDGTNGYFSYDSIEAGDIEKIMYGGKAETETKGGKLIKKKFIPVARGWKSMKDKNFKKMLKSMVDAYKDVTEQ